MEHLFRVMILFNTVSFWQVLIWDLKFYICLCLILEVLNSLMYNVLIGCLLSVPLDTTNM